jgi:hypothetical protein
MKFITKFNFPMTYPKTNQNKINYLASNINGRGKALVSDERKKQSPECRDEVAEHARHTQTASSWLGVI